MWNVLKKKEITREWTTRHLTGWPRKTITADDRNTVRERKNTTQLSVTSPAASTRQWWGYYDPPRWLQEQKLRGHMTWYKPLISNKDQKTKLEFSNKYRDDPNKSWNHDYGTSSKVMERPNCGERKYLLHNIQVPSLVRLACCSNTPRGDCILWATTLTGYWRWVNYYFLRRLKISQATCCTIFSKLLKKIVYGFPSQRNLISFYIYI